MSEISKAPMSQPESAEGREQAPELPFSPTFGPYRIHSPLPCYGERSRFRAFHDHPHMSDRVFELELLGALEVDDSLNPASLARVVKALAELRHGNVVPTVELRGDNANEWCIVSEFVDGVDLESLRGRLAALGLGIPPPLCLHIVGEILRGLVAAHGRAAPILHRSIAPRSVLLSYAGAVKLGGFAAAAVVEAGWAATAADANDCLAPEQVAGYVGDQRSDIFAVGRLLDLLLADGATAGGAAAVPMADRLAEQVTAVTGRAFAQDPEERFATAAAMLAALAPLLPGSPGVRLAIASLARTGCAEELHQQRWQRAGTEPAGKMVALLPGPGPATEALGKTLLAAGFCTELHESPATLDDSLNGALPPRALFVDLSSQSIDLGELRRVLALAVAPVPVIAVVDAGNDAMTAAYELGAVDLLTRPVAAPRIAVAVHAALMANVPSRRVASSSSRLEMVTKLLLVSADPALASRLLDPMRHYGYQLDVVSDVTAALAHADRTSCLGVIHDSPDAQRAHELVQRLRGLPTMGVIPVLRLVAGHGPQLLEDRVAIRKRTDDAAVIAVSIAQLHSDDNAARTFKRFAATLAARVTHDGRVHDARVIGLSRGGARLECDRVPPDSGTVEIEIEPAGVGDAIRVSARVVRAESRGHGSGRASVAFTRFDGHHESLLIAALRDLAAAGATGQPLG